MSFRNICALRRVHDGLVVAPGLVCVHTQGSHGVCEVFKNAVITHDILPDLGTEILLRIANQEILAL